MKIKVSKLVNAVPSIKYLMNQSLNAKVSLKLARFINTISNEMNAVEETRKMLFDRYSDGTKILNESNLKFEEEMKSLLETEISINMEPISIAELNTISIPINHMMNLDFMFKD